MCLNVLATLAIVSKHAVGRSTGSLAVASCSDTLSNDADEAL